MPRLMSILISLTLGIVLGACVSFERDEQPPLDAPGTETGDKARTDTSSEPPRHSTEPSRSPLRHAAPPRDDLAEGTDDRAEPMPRVDSQASLRVTGMLLDEFGHAVAKTALHWRVRFGPQALDGYLRTGPDGRFEFTLKGALHAGAIGRLELEPGRPPYGLRVTRPSLRQAAAILPEPLLRGEIDLGKLRFGLLPLSCSGRVVDTAGQPLPGSEVWAQVRRSGESGPMGYPLEVGSDGSFELRLPYQPESIDLRAGFDGKLPASRAGIAPGERGIELRLDEASTLSGWVEGSIVGSDIVLVDSAGHRHDSPTRWSRDGRTTFEFREVHPGPAQLRIDRNGAAGVDRQVLLAPGYNALLN